MNTGIYTITSPSGKRYVGSATNIRMRWNMHRSMMVRGVHHTPALQAAFLKYGAGNLTFKKLLICSKEDLLFYEQRAIDTLKPEYNASQVAEITFGVKRPEVAAKMRGRKHTKEAIERMKNLSQEQRESRSRAGSLGGAAGGRAGKGKKKSEETRRKMSEAAKLRNFANHFKGNQS